MPSLASLRRTFHRAISKKLIRFSKNRKGQPFPNFADGTSRTSVTIAMAICEQLHVPSVHETVQGQTLGKEFERITQEFLSQATRLLSHLKFGDWHVAITETDISNFVQYRHLKQLADAIQSNADLAVALGTDYLVTPDIIVSRSPVSDNEINSGRHPVLNPKNRLAKRTPFRAANHGSDNPCPFLHASISCKWTIRSDRAQNTRTAALNLIRNRKGPLPRIVAITAEPMPTRIASLALGTGDLDCVYHFALPEMRQACEQNELNDQLELLDDMIRGDRLRDISDLAFDLLI